MFWGDKRYNNLNFALRKYFKEKIYKVSLDGGFTCPNRDGTISKNGCIFCNETGSGDFTSDHKKSINEQINEQLKLISQKFPNGKVIAYFQNFTNTYANVDYLRKIYYEALSHEKVVGLAIATRSDCLQPDILELLNEINKKTFLWIEIGLQTIKESSANFINRGYDLNCFEKSLNNLNQINIKIVVHLILGLPGETKEDILNSVEYLSKRSIWGIKLHLLYITKNTSLYEIYKKNNFYLFEKLEYIELICEIISKMNPNIIIHRLTGDGNKETLFAPKWSLDKRSVLNGINKSLKEKKIHQGIYFNYDK